MGHNYNIMDVNEGKMITVEAASKGRWSIKEIGAQPFFHANMYIHLRVDQVQSLRNTDFSLSKFESGFGKSCNYLVWSEQHTYTDVGTS